MIFLVEKVLFKVVESNIGILTLNRPKAANALSRKLIEDFIQMIEKVNRRTDILCTIITGSTNRVFCAGADLKERRTMSEDEVFETVELIGQLTTKVEQMKMPTIAALNGAAFGGGLELALACDLRLAKKNISMGLTETSLAIIPGAGGTQRLPRLIGIGKAKELIYTSKRISSEKAYQIGLIEQIFPEENFLNAVIDYAKKIAKNGPIALQQAKLAINKGIEVDLHTGLDIERLCYKETIPTEDRLEGLKAFQEKRAPKYKGK